MPRTRTGFAPRRGSRPRRHTARWDMSTQTRTPTRRQRVAGPAKSVAVSQYGSTASPIPNRQICGTAPETEARPIARRVTRMTRRTPTRLVGEPGRVKRAAGSIPSIAAMQSTGSLRTATWNCVNSRETSAESARRHLERAFRTSIIVTSLRRCEGCCAVAATPG